MDPMPSTPGSRGARRRAGGIVAAALVAVALPVACSSSPTRDAATFCAGYVSVARRGAALSDPDDVSVAALRTQVAAIDDAATDAVRHAPADIADDAGALADAVHVLREALDAASTRTAATTALAAYRAAVAQLAASQRRLDAWSEAHCHVAPVTTVAPTTATASTEPPTEPPATEPPATDTSGAGSSGTDTSGTGSTGSTG
jgi:hypothetical protein